MKGVVGCLQQGALASSDVCGLRASPLPHPHFPGNMWAARCSYVARLPDPSKFNKKMVLASKSRGGKCQPWHVGLSRFSAEHWILAHPSAVVSDSLPPTFSVDKPDYAWGHAFLPDPTAWAPLVKTFPRSGLAAHWFFYEHKDFGYTALHCSHESYRVEEYVSLYGPGVMRDLPCGSMYCQWFPTAFLQLHHTHVPLHARVAVAGYLDDMRAFGKAPAAANKAKQRQRSKSSQKS